VRDKSQPGILPLRPLTTGELLDAAVALLRARGAKLILLGFVFALAEQAALFPLRRLTDLNAWFLPATDELGRYWIPIAAGFATEAFSIAMLGGIAATSAPPALLGPTTAKRRLRWGPVIIVGLVQAVLLSTMAWGFVVFPQRLALFGLVLAFLVTPLFWIIAYGPLGLAVPAVVIDQVGPLRALGRSVQLTTRNLGRAMGIRTLGYMVWLLIRLGSSLAALAVINLVYTSPSTTVDNLLLGGAWLLVNALAYPVLGCLDVVLHLEMRMRTEGLDLALSRAVRRGVTADVALAIPARPAA
jgi:hypothetical protein